MPHAALETFLAGMVAMGYLIAGGFFLRFWRQTRDELFLAFALAFWLMACNQVVAALLGGMLENKAYVYLFRLAAFLLIAAAVVRKNARRKR